MVTEMTGFHTISVHVWHLLTIPALKGLGGGRSSRAFTGTTFTDSCSTILAEQGAIRQLVRGGWHRAWNRLLHRKSATGAPPWWVRGAHL